MAQVKQITLTRTQLVQAIETFVNEHVFKTSHQVASVKFWEHTDSVQVDIKEEVYPPVEPGV